MHEFSLAQNIIEIVEENARQNHAERVTEVVLEIGTLSGVELPALDMALQSLQPGTLMEHAAIKKNIIKALARCGECHFQFVPDDYFCACPKCGSFLHEVIQGKELRVKSIVAE